MQKLTKKYKKIAFSLIAVILGATLFGCSNNAANNTTVANTTPTAAASPSATSEIVKKEETPAKTEETPKTSNKKPTDKNVIEVETLTADYKKSKEEVQKKYGLKLISVRGIAFVEPSISDDGSGLLSVKVKGDPLSDVKCWFDKQHGEAFKKIQPDNVIIVKGIFDGELFPELKGCELVKVE